ncbi:MAG: chemotaxis protein CheW [Rubrivivax sp.]
MASDEAPGGTQVLGFSLGAHACALEIRGVREIIQVGPMTPVPLMPGFVRGVINLRGAVVPVIDLHARFGHAPARVGKKSCIVVYDATLAGERSEIGLLVDAVSEVVEIDAAATEPPPAFGTPIAREFIRAVAKVRGRFVLLLEPERACDIGELAALCEAGAEPVAA